MSDPSEAADLLYGVPAIAEYLELRPRVIHHMIDRIGLPTFKLGGKVCARRSTLMTWLAERDAAARKVTAA